MHSLNPLKATEEIFIYTDGASSGNPGPSGWGAIIFISPSIPTKESVHEIGGYEALSTNNRMELTAAIEPLEILIQREKKLKITLYSDSTYVINGITKWICNWKKRDWITSQGKPVANTDLWEKLFILNKSLSINWKHVSGHSGNPGNERADTIATSFARFQKPHPLPLYQGALSGYFVNVFPQSKKNLPNPNEAAPLDSGIFGLQYTQKESTLVFIPVPWEATTSYGGGTSQGPSAMLKASHQLDLFHLKINRPYAAGICMLKESEWIKKSSALTKEKAQKIIHSLTKPSDPSKKRPNHQKELEKINHASHKLNNFVYQETKRLLQDNKIVGIVGGDHSAPFGAIKAISEKIPHFGILHFDAHFDTRKAYEGFEDSHASIMYNVLEKIPQVIQLTQVGIRDFCEEEIHTTQKHKQRVRTFFDQTLVDQKHKGRTWDQISQDIVMPLPKEIWISFDIDGLDPRFCPNTGTPVPGGLDFYEVTAIFELLVRSGRRIIGFDLCEVTPDLKHPENEWDANVGARLLYQLAAWTLASQGKVELLQHSTPEVIQKGNEGKTPQPKK